jgi:rhodanese-related sulfurtransferase
MKRRIFLAMLLTCAALPGASHARAQAPAREVPADRVTLEEFKKLRDAGKVYVLDVRYQIDKKIKGATHIPLDQLEARLAELPRDREIITYCS